MKLLTVTAGLALSLAATTPALANIPVHIANIQPGKTVLAQLLTPDSSTSGVSAGAILADSQSAAGYQLTGELLLQLSNPATFTALAAQYNLQLKQQYKQYIIASAAPTANLQQLLNQLQQEPAILAASLDLRELGLSPDPQVRNEPD